MTIPNLGVTGIIQQPGMGGIIGQNLSSLAQTLMARQQAEEERAQRERQYELQLAQLGLQRATTAEKLRGERQIGRGLEALLSPQQISLDIATKAPEVVGRGGVPADRMRMAVPTVDAQGQVQSGFAPQAGAPIPVRTERERTLQEVLSTIDPQFRESFLTASKDIVTSREAARKAAEQAKAQQEAFGKVLASVPEDIRPAMQSVILGKQAELPADMLNELYKNIATRLPASTIQAFDDQYPVFKDLPLEQKLAQITELKALEAQRRMQIGPEYDRIVGRQIQQARLQIDRANLQLRRQETDGGANHRQAAMDIIRQVTDVLQNDLMTFGQPMESRVLSLMGKEYLTAWKKAQDYLIARGLEIPTGALVPPPQGTARPGMPGILGQ